MSKQKTNKIVKDLKRKTRLEQLFKAGEFYSDLDERLEHNQNIGILPDTLKNFTPTGERGMIVALYKFTEHTTEAGGIIDPKYLKGTTSAGRPEGLLDDFNFQARGVIVMLSDEAKKWIEENNSTLAVGQTVWLTQQAMSANYQFIHSRIHPVVKGKYLKIHPSLVEGIENCELVNIRFEQDEQETTDAAETNQ